MIVKTIVLNEERNVTLTALIQDVGGEYRNVTKRPFIVVLPGGGYEFCSDREAEPVAFSFLKAGYSVFILRYSVGEYCTWPRPLEDYDEAVEYIKKHAEEWNLLPDKMAVIGFSAGGHLAGAAATMAKNRPNAAILGYAVVSEQVKEICQGSAPDVISAVDEHTSPCFLFASRTDNVVPIYNTIEMMAALEKNGISFESHVYAFGPHGFSTADSSIQLSTTLMTSRVKNWVDDSIGWLKDMLGDFGTDGMTKPKCKGKMTDDGEAWMSLDCTIGRLFGNPVAMEVLKDVVAEMKEKIEPFAPTLTFDDMMGLLSAMKLRDLLIERNICVDQFDELDDRLGKVPNI